MVAQRYDIPVRMTEPSLLMLELVLSALLRGTIGERAGVLIVDSTLGLVAGDICCNSFVLSPTGSSSINRLFQFDEWMFIVLKKQTWPSGL